MADDVEKRAAEIREHNASAKAAEEATQRARRHEYQRLHSRYLTALAGRTQYPVETTATEDEDRIGFRVCFRFYDKGQSWTLDVVELGVSSVSGPEERRAFKYYLSPASAAFRVSHPKIDGRLSVSDAPQGEVLAKAVEITFEMMAHIVASGGQPGSLAEVQGKVGAFVQVQQKRERERKRKRGRNQRTGCLAVFGIFLAFCFLLGLLNNLGGG